jgi:hypothetical protein
MTRKDYKLIAEVLNRATKNWEEFQEENPSVVIAGISAMLATQLAQENPRFDRSKFLTACGVK